MNTKKTNSTNAQTTPVTATSNRSTLIPVEGIEAKIPINGEITLRNPMRSITVIRVKRGANIHKRPDEELPWYPRLMSVNMTITPIIVGD
ncbi:hypothetical protein [Natrarchaeobaculum sulfurireducens]|uniref:hypothetical protein n=1 Tax=Natrarchaeobaculum sulfurireducens TaxID=2044521 RepID=UPI00137958DA|nr:hypothetical protein [Natrarchaeobaculum sulfurireducens]